MNVACSSHVGSIIDIPSHPTSKLGSFCRIANSAESGSALASGLTPMEEEALYRDIDQLDPENM